MVGFFPASWFELCCLGNHWFFLSVSLSTPRMCFFSRCRTFGSIICVGGNKLRNWTLHTSQGTWRRQGGAVSRLAPQGQGYRRRGAGGPVGDWSGASRNSTWCWLFIIFVFLFCWQFWLASLSSSPSGCCLDSFFRRSSVFTSTYSFLIAAHSKYDHSVLSWRVWFRC